MASNEKHSQPAQFTLVSSPNMGRTLSNHKENGSGSLHAAM